MVTPLNIQFLNVLVIILLVDDVCKYVYRFFFFYQK